MTINPQRLFALDFPEVTHRYSWRDSAIYALSLGCGLDPVADGDLGYVDESAIKALPAMVTVLASPGFWSRDLDSGIDWRKVVNGQQDVVWHRSLAPEGEVRARTKIVGLVDKGEGRGALVTTERCLRDTASDLEIATVRQTIFCRADGGFGGSPNPTHDLPAVPGREPDLSASAATSPQAALIHRLCGDLNPLHSSLAAARLAGFERPILHGLATYGVVQRVLLLALCRNDPARVREMSCRYSAPVVPGDVVTVDIWRISDGHASFSARVANRGATVLSHGEILYS